MKLTIQRNTLIQVLLAMFLWLIFANADIGYSLDYKHYVNYIDQIKLLTNTELAYIKNGIYINLENSAGMEIGFVYAVKLLSLIFDDSIKIYAAIAILSLLIKSYLFRTYNVPWIWGCLALIVSGILLESNALRSAISLSFFMLSLHFYDRNKFLLYIISSLLAVTMHIQAIIFIFLYVVLFLFKRFSLFSTNKIVFFIIFTSLLLGPVLQNFMAFYIYGGKLDFYALNESASSGLNLISIFSVIVCIVIYHEVIIRNYKVVMQDYRLQLMLIVAAFPFLSMYIFFTKIAVISDRLWQWSYLLLVWGYFSIENKDSKGSVFYGKISIVRSLFLILFVIYIVNITIRYPLSNFLYPITPYIDFSKNN